MLADQGWPYDWCKADDNGEGDDAHDAIDCVAEAEHASGARPVRSYDTTGGKRRRCDPNPNVEELSDEDDEAHDERQTAVLGKSERVSDQHDLSQIRD